MVVCAEILWLYKPVFVYQLFRWLVSGLMACVVSREIALSIMDLECCISMAAETYAYKDVFS